MTRKSNAAKYSAEKQRSVAGSGCAIGFVSDTIVPQLTLEEYDSDSDHSNVDSADFDSEKRLADKPVITRCGRQVKAWIRFDAQAVTKHKASSLKEQRHCLHILKS